MKKIVVTECSTKVLYCLKGLRYWIKKYKYNNGLYSIINILQNKRFMWF